ncbi:LLM class flavin-dependent oxidoreductase [Corynebacterium crudilactis]|uniref:Luciferase n=1 Tax=Corynebacterium crudilactis TaxID=1652495 RepID=A0A172QUQ0_9CORY|nr:LLM class flavin-dependent oxidoreductase [Corynebacterium crudilactis]ANE04370.1 luciferase [Corynebacterium crudilactis]
MKNISFGLDTFGDNTVDLQGAPVSPAQTLRNIVEEAKMAEKVGVDIIGIGEHHREDYAVSAPDIVMTAILASTEKLKVTSSVTVLSSDDPVRIFERYSTMNALSQGRAEITLGRGSFIESFPLFGFDLQDYEKLFSERLDLFAKILAADSRGEAITWHGETRPALENQMLYPPTEAGIQAWVAVGGSPESVVRAAKYRFPLMLAVIGGAAERFRPYADLYKRANEQFGQPQMPIGVHSPGLVAATDAEARELSLENWLEQQRKIGAERGWAPADATQFEREIDHGALYIGSPETVAKKIAKTISALDLDRFTLKYANGPTSHEHLLKSIELYGTEVIPMVKDILSKKA